MVCWRVKQRGVFLFEQLERQPQDRELEKQRWGLRDRDCSRSSLSEPDPEQGGSGGGPSHPGAEN